MLTITGVQRACSKDEFSLTSCPQLGTLKKVRISHDNSGYSPNWFLEEIYINDVEAGRVYRCPCHCWLAENMGDGQLSRELLCTDQGAF